MIMSMQITCSFNFTFHFVWLRVVKKPLVYQAVIQRKLLLLHVFFYRATNLFILPPSPSLSLTHPLIAEDQSAEDKLTAICDVFHFTDKGK